MDNYLKSSKCQRKEIKVNLSKEYNILVDETAFYSKVINTVPAKDKMIKISNQNKEASNNEIMNKIKPQNVIKENNENYYNDEMFGYNEEEKEEEEQGENESVKQQQPEEKKNFIMGIFSKFFRNDNNSNNNNKNNIIKKKQYHYKFKQIPMKLSNKKRIFKCVLLLIMNHASQKNLVL